MRLKLSNPPFRILLWLVYFWLITIAQEASLLYGAEDSEREITIRFNVSEKSVKISAVGIGTLGTTDESGKLEKSLKVKNETLILKFQKKGYLERTKILRLTDTKKKEFTQTIILEPERSTKTEMTKTQEDEEERFITLGIPRAKISELSDESGVPISLEEDELKTIRALLSGGEKEMSISLEGDNFFAKIREKPDISTNNRRETVPPSASSSHFPDLLVIDDSGNKIPYAVVKVNDTEPGQTDEYGKFYNLSKYAAKIKIEVSKEGYEQVSGLEEIDLKSESYPLVILLKNLSTVTLVIQVNYKEGLLFSTPKFQLGSSPFNSRQEYLWSVLTSHNISLPEKERIEPIHNKDIIRSNEQIYVIRKGKKRLNIFQEGKPVANALIEINDKKNETDKHGRVTFSGVSVPTTGRLNITVSKGLMSKEENEIDPNSPEPIKVTLVPKKWIEVKVSSKEVPLQDTTVTVDGELVGKTDRYGRLIIPLDPSKLPKKYIITAEHPRKGKTGAMDLEIHRNQKVYQCNITLE